MNRPSKAPRHGCLFFVCHSEQSEEPAALVVIPSEGEEPASFVVIPSEVEEPAAQPPHLPQPSQRRVPHIYDSSIVGDVGSSLPKAEPIAFSQAKRASMNPETTPLCPHFGPCGGCQLQHLTYPTQLATKQQTLEALLTGLNYPPIQIHTADPWHYRNRIRLRIEPGPDNTFLLGYNQHASNTFLPISTCPISAPVLLRTAQALTALAPTNPTVAKWLSVTAELELFTTPDESRLQLTLLLSAAPDIPAPQLARTFTALCGLLKNQAPALGGAGAEFLRNTRANSLKPFASRRSAAAFTPPTWGSPGLLYPVTLNTTEQQLWVSRASFFQVNRHLLETLVYTATQAAVPGHLSSRPEAPASLPEASSQPQASASIPEASSRPERTARSGETPAFPGPFQPTKAALAWDLFSGVGLFTRALLPFFPHITAVESAPASTADLTAARLPGVHVITSTVLDFLRVAALDRDRPALVLLDPPRAGLGVEAATLLARLHPPRIIYVSCDPTTLARDLRAMLSSGYNLAELHLVDMFPQTSHLETVAILHLDPDYQA